MLRRILINLARIWCTAGICGGIYCLIKLAHAHLSESVFAWIVLGVISVLASIVFAWVEKPNEC